MRNNLLTLSLLLFVVFLSSCNTANKNVTIREPVDTVGFAQHSWQMDSVICRIDSLYADSLKNFLVKDSVNHIDYWKTAISPHDDYSYVGYLYPAVLNNVKAKTIIFFGVAHKARLLNLENQIIFDSYTFWKEPYGNIKVSPIREEIIKKLPENIYQVNDSMQSIEHSVEAIIPFLQHNNHDVQIVSIIVPYMSFERMKVISKHLSKAINYVAEQKKWEWGKDYAFVISTDAVHYGDKDWGTSELDFYGSDTAGYKKAVKHEHEIINNSLVGKLTQEKIHKFVDFTTDKNNFKKGTWSWCGRYSVPVGLLTTLELQKLQNKELKGTLVGYANSIDHKHIKVDDIGMGVTAPANIHHWVGYAAVGYY